jgi:pyruvate dehydrogenase E1 component alpha subunit/2-oxoisovalerate dehydrogenase E1 component alpha subunit
MTHGEMDSGTTAGPTAAPPTDGRGPAWSYFEQDEEGKALGLFQILDENGEWDPANVTGFDKQLSVQLYRGMLFTRLMDERFMALQRQGVLGFYAETLGQEAATIGSAAAMEPQDWLVPALREHGAGLYRGMDFASFVAQLFGNANDVTLGRQMPLHPTDRATHYVNMSSCIATQIPHAVGIAMGMKIGGEKDAICVGYMGDGATSEGEFHVAMNFAGVTKAPVVLICQNNQWAISTPGAGQTASETIAIKGLGYGMESLRADGNDILAVYEITKYAADKARRGGGPTFIELLTYRVSAHTSSDDPSRYRDESVTEVWKTVKDPLRRMRIFLDKNGWLSEAEHEAMCAQIESTVRDMVKRQRDVPAPAVGSLVEDVFEHPWWRLVEGKQVLENE